MLYALFWNVFLWIYRALISELEFAVGNILKEINKETDEAEKTDEVEKLSSNVILKKTEELIRKVQYLKITDFSLLLHINDKKRQFEQSAPIFFKVFEMNQKIRMLIKTVENKNVDVRRKKLKENASTFREIIADCNSLFQQIGITPLDQKKVEELDILVQNALSASASSKI